MVQPDLRRCIDDWRERLRVEERERRRSEEAARQLAGRCAAVLAERYGVDPVWMVGSPATAGRFHARLDVDLVVERPAVERYGEALAEVAEVARRDVDLIRAEDARAEPLARARTEGVLLHGGV